MAKTFTAILLAVFFFASCRKEKGDENFSISATYKNHPWLADTVWAFFSDPKHLNIGGFDNKASVNIQLNYTGAGTYPVDIMVKDINPWYANSHNVAAMDEKGYYIIIYPEQIRGSVEIQSVSSRAVKGTFYLDYIYDAQHQGSNFKVTNGKFFSPIR